MRTPRPADKAPRVPAVERSSPTAQQESLAFSTTFSDIKSFLSPPRLHATACTRVPSQEQFRAFSLSGGWEISKMTGQDSPSVSATPHCFR